MPTIDSATLPQMEWRTAAACRDSDPELFFPIGDAGPARTQEHRARGVCAGCPVREACLLWALDHGPEGVWGGTTTAERHRMRRSRTPRDRRS